MNELDAREQARATDDVASARRLAPVWAMPNVTLEESIEASHAALVNRHDERLRSIARRRPALETFLNAFRDEFGTQIWPTIAMVREGVSPRVRTVTALSGFRDAVCVSAIVAGHADPWVESTPTPSTSTRGFQIRDMRGALVRLRQR